MPQAALRRAASRAPQKKDDSAIGWISFSDTLFLGFTCLLLYSLKLSLDLRSNASLAQQQAVELQDWQMDKKNSVKHLRDLEADLEAARKEIVAIKTQAAQAATAQKRVRHELLGLRGDLRNVAIVIDSSQSMKSGGRWQEATSLMGQWVECLDMQACVVIVFHNHVYRRPQKGVFDFVNDRESAIAEIRNFLQRVEPKGQTNTLDALKAAYEVPGLDTIILFTDGSPNLEAKAGSDPVLVESIYELCRSKKEIPINAIGIGNYFKPEFSKFLLALAEITGGTFIGR